MPLDFPPSPSLNEIYTFGGRSWQWNGTAWDVYSTTPVVNTLNGLTGTVGLSAGSGITLTSAGNTITISSSASGGGISGPYVVSFNGLTGAVQGISSFNGLTGAVQGVSSIRGLTGTVGLTNGSGISLSVSGNTLTVSNTGVLSIDGSTGAISNVARTNVNNNFSAPQTISASGAVFGIDDTLNSAGVTIDPVANDIIWRNGLNQSILDFNPQGQTVTLPNITTILAGLSGTQTFGGTKTFDALTTFNVGLSSAGGTFSGLVRFNAGLSASGATFTGPVNFTNTLLINSSQGSNNQVLTSTGSGITWATPSGSGLTQYVSTFNGLTGSVNLAAGTGITLSVSGNTFTIASTSSGGGGSSIYSTTQTIDFSELVNQIELVIYGVGVDFGTILRNIENNPPVTVVFDTGSAVGYSCVLESIQSFYDDTNGWSARLIIKPPFTGGIGTTAEAIIAETINTVYITTATAGDFWTNIQSQTLFHQQETYTIKTITGITWITPDTFVDCKVLGLTTADHTAEDAILEQVSFEINNIVGGTGFDVIGHAPNGTYGKYSIKCQGS